MLYIIIVCWRLLCANIVAVHPLRPVSARGPLSNNNNTSNYNNNTNNVNNDDDTNINGIKNNYDVHNN